MIFLRALAACAGIGFFALSVLAAGGDWIVKGFIAWLAFSIVAVGLMLWATGQMEDGR